MNSSREIFLLPEQETERMEKYVFSVIIKCEQQYCVLLHMGKTKESVYSQVLLSMC